MFKTTAFKPAPHVKVLINIGALMDVPTGYYYAGVHGEEVLNGGLGFLTGMTGKGNSFKSTTVHYMVGSAANRLSYAGKTKVQTYDTETNIHERRLLELMKQFEKIYSEDMFRDGFWTLTDKTVQIGEKWFEDYKAFLKEKEQNARSITYKTPFLDVDRKGVFETLMPTFSEVDSFTNFETSDVSKIMDENELGDSAGNIIHARQGLAKMRFLMEVPTLAGKYNHFTLLTAHLGSEMGMQAGPHSAPPEKKLQHLKAGTKIKGVTDQFLFLTSNFWHASTTTPLIERTTKTCEYPKDTGDKQDDVTDLFEVSLKLLRGKAGPSGFSLPLIVSQTEGVLPSLTEFHYLKNNDRFGLSGTLQHYSLDILPDVKLSRTTVRGKIDADPMLRRALNITAEHLQLRIYHRGLAAAEILPKDLYEAIKAKGYSWDTILGHTRGWWTMNNDKIYPYFLSTLDILKMAQGRYHPFWLEDDKVTVKKAYAGLQK